jgi:hypothetical protein
MTGQSLPDTELDRLVVQGCANDYEDFDMIVSEVHKWTKSEFNVPEISKIENALMKAIATNDVIAYEYNEPARLTPAHVDPQNISTIMFYATEHGREKLRKLEVAGIVSGPDDELGYLVLKAVANKYATLDMIVSETAGVTNNEYGAPKNGQIERALRKFVADHDVTAYERYNKHSGFTRALADHQNIRTLYFYITEQCKRRLKELEAEEMKTEGKLAL